MPNSTPQGAHRKTLAVKHTDGEPLTRVDLQYDLLDHIFNNSLAVFSDPYPTLHGNPAGSKVTFRDLYINCLIHSSRCSKASKEKIQESPAFGDEFGKMSLLSNVGRINTTMAFFPEMRTALRTYHPVPSLQKTDGNLQDAPRIKNILKSCFLDNESQGALLTPSDVLARTRSGEAPVTSIVNLIFIFASHAASVARTHFGSHSSFDFLDLFTPINVSSESRARAFLWLCYHYHEAPSYRGNPFSDTHSNISLGQIPPLITLSPEEAALENVDTAEEKQWGQRMTLQRRDFVESKAREDGEDILQERTHPRSRPNTLKGRGKGKGKATAGTSNKIREREVSPSESQTSLAPTIKEEDSVDSSRHGSPPLVLPPLRHLHPHQSSLPSFEQFSHRPPPPDFLINPRASADPYPCRIPSPASVPSTNGKPMRTRTRRPREAQTQDMQHAMLLYPSPTYVPPTYVAPSYPVPAYHTPRQPAPASVVSRRSMLEQAWHVVMTTDPLRDSDEEDFADENTRLDYVLRLRIISRLRGKEPTPEPEPLPTVPPPVNLHSSSF
ncbi:hypothetical protein AcW2_001044 [Taiwanofungus camphoratus]|nr:hypothetical protein AcW2_001044 [Antrodia cinnamomea]